MGVGGGCDGAEPRLPGHVTDNTVSTGPRWCRAGKPRAARGAALSTSCFFVVGAVPGGGPDLHGAMLRRAVGPQTGLQLSHPFYGAEQTCGDAVALAPRKELGTANPNARRHGRPGITNWSASHPPGARPAQAPAD